MKWLSIELSLLLLVSLVAGVGLFSLGGSASVDNAGSYAVSDLSGFQTVSPSQTSTGVYSGLGQQVIRLGTVKIVDSLTGQTCFYHKKTGDYYRFVVKGYGLAGNIMFTKEYPASPGWFGGKGGACQPIKIALSGVDNPVSEIRISGVAVKGSPNVYNTKFDAVLGLQPTPTPAPKLDLSYITGPTFGFSFAGYDLSLTTKLALEGESFKLSSAMADQLDTFPLRVLFDPGYKINHVLLNKDGSKRAILMHMNAPADDMKRATALLNYYNTLPGVVAKLYNAHLQAEVGQLFDFNPK